MSHGERVVRTLPLKEVLPKLQKRLGIVRRIDLLTSFSEIECTLSTYTLRLEEYFGATGFHSESGQRFLSEELLVPEDRDAWGRYYTLERYRKDPTAESVAL